MTLCSRTSSAHRRNYPGIEQSAWAILLLPLIVWAIAPTLQAQERLGHSLTPVDPPVTAPDFRLQNMDEEALSLESLRGQVVLLNFWATWCPPCLREMPSMERLNQALDSESFTVVAVNQYESPDHVFAYLGQLDTDLTFPILFDPDSAASAAFNVKGLPSTFLIDRRGQIRYRAIGGREFDHPEVIAIIRALLAEP